MSVIASNGGCVHLSPRAGRGRIALAIRVRGRLNKRSRDGFKNPRHVHEYIVIPKSQNPIIVVRKPFVANGIAQIVSVLPTIYLNHQTTFATHKIDGVEADRLLSNEFVANKPARPQPKPQCGFRLGSGPSQSPRSPGPDCIGFSHAATPPHPDHRFAMIRPLPARGERLAQCAPT
jgi:hypothetical protein